LTANLKAMSLKGWVEKDMVQMTIKAILPIGNLN